jgi:ribosomal protein S13
VGRNKAATVEAFCALEAAAKNMGLTVNEEKTKFMAITNRTQNLQPLKVNEYEFEQVTQFKYLGTIINTSNDIKIEIKDRIKMANRCYHGLRNQLKSKVISSKTKVQLYKTLVRPIVLYGSERWTIKKDEEEKLMSFERKILRKIFGAVRENGIWRIRYNHELQLKYREPNIIKVIKASQIRWLGHIFRYDDENPVRKVTFQTPEGKRRRGRPRMRWMDRVEKWLRDLGVNRWKNMASSRTGWKKLTETALAGNRL